MVRERDAGKQQRDEKVRGAEQTDKKLSKQSWMDRRSLKDSRRELPLVLAFWLVPVSALMIASKDGTAEVIGRLYSTFRISEILTDSWAFANDFRFWGCILALSMSHVFYFFVWTNSGTFYRAMAKLGKPYRVFASIAHLVKIAQATCVFSYIAQPFLENFEANLRSLDPYQALLGAQLLCFGQTLNYYVYKRIGEVGVYYGTRLGENVPWVESFPFNTISHPQYVGATMSAWGGYILLGSMTGMVQIGLWCFPCFITVGYIFTGLVEQYF